jgi:hypothetical protein
MHYDTSQQPVALPQKVGEHINAKNHPDGWWGKSSEGGRIRTCGQELKRLLLCH